MGKRKVGRTLRASTNFGTFSKSHSYTYFPNGPRSTFIDPEGGEYKYSWTKNGLPSSIEVPGSQTISYAYTDKDWMQPTAQLLPGGTRKDFSYDALRRISEIKAKDKRGATLLDYQYTYQDGRIVKKATEHGEYNYGYDAAGRLSSINSPVENTIYTYDTFGNRSPVGETCSYTPLGAPLECEGRQYTYDKDGNRVSNTDSSGTTRYIYNEADRLVGVKDSAGTEIASYGYSPMGPRLSKAVSGKTQYFYYTEDGLSAEYDESGEVQRSYIYEPGSYWQTSPLAERGLDGNYYYINDHLGTPQQLVDINGALAWGGKYKGFGEATTSEPRAVNPHRFPGQYYDSETGLHQNLWRMYDPWNSGYNEIDLIEMMDTGPNRYVYADADPISSVDMSGLAKCTYSITLHTLICISNDGGDSLALGPDGLFSGRKKCKDNPECQRDAADGPIVSGQYDMNKDDRPGHEDYWRLEPNPKIPGWQCFFELRRCGFQLHPGSFSLGCITADKTNSNVMDQYRKLNELLNSENEDNHLVVKP